MNPLFTNPPNTAPAGASALPSAAPAAAWMLRPLKERVYLKWRVRIEYSHVAGGKLIHDQSPWFDVLAPEGDNLRRLAMLQISGNGLLPPLATIENWQAELKTDVDGRSSLECSQFPVPSSKAETTAAEKEAA